VAGEDFEQELAQWCQQVWELQPVFIRAAKQGFGVTSAYTHADRLGADRWVAMVAAQRQVRGASCVIDCGTATTIDVLQADGQHLGGLILPGLQLMAESLSTRTRIVVDETEGGNTTLFARNTADAIHGGALYAQVATLDRVYNDVEQALEMPVNRVITGGNAAEILPLLSGEHQHMPDLVLQGLMIIAESMQEANS
jgi:type III pantothenate kinase